jgi:hypothetical protein
MGGDLAKVLIELPPEHWYSESTETLWNLIEQ